ncbi:glycerophosphodiester phosphodiesterase family protein [Streptomyces longispororuber]|nr:glycerophosphodiester phosphodiesterase family protein [Streptomyces longispororuber]
MIQRPQDLPHPHARPGPRRPVAALTAVCALVVLGAAPDAVARAVPQESAADRAYRDFLDRGADAKVMTVAHRGQWREAPENSLAAVRAAFADGAELVEVDVRLTKDRVPVLMHDATVDRTTDGKGRVADLTLAELGRLRLRKGLGGAQAPLTGQRVPTLADVMRVAKRRGLVNLDKAWDAREEAWRVLTATGTVRNGLFKSAAPVDEVRAFLAGHRGALYAHTLDDDNRGAVEEFGPDQPLAYEVGFDKTDDAVADPAFLGRLRSTGRVWINSMEDDLAAGHTDEASLIDPARGWGALLRTYRANVIQTDDVEALEEYLATGRAGAVPRGAVRVQGEAYAEGGEGVAYHDTDADNRGDGPGRPGEGVDVCDHDGAIAVCWMRGSEWLTYQVDVARPGRYTVAARVSSPYSPAGSYRIALGRGAPSGPVAVGITTAHRAYELQRSRVTLRLPRGRHTLRLSLDEGAFQNWNLDYLQLEPRWRPVRRADGPSVADASPAPPKGP